MMNGTSIGGGILSGSGDRYASAGYAPAPTSGGTPVKMNATGMGGGAPIILSGPGVAESGMMQESGSSRRAK